MATLRAIAPVANGGRFQQSSATTLTPIVPSDTVPVGPCAQIICITAGTLSLGMWDGSTVAQPMTIGQTLFVSPRLVKVATTGTYNAGL